MRVILDVQRTRIQLAKDRLAFMPDPSWVLNSTMDLILVRKVVGWAQHNCTVLHCAYLTFIVLLESGGL